MNRLCLSLLLLSACLPAVAGTDWVKIPSGEFASILKYQDSVDGMQKVPAFSIMKTPVTNAQFLTFAQQNPKWQRENIPAIFAEHSHYLIHWQSNLKLGKKALAQQPVTQVSWFAASAFCEAQGARLPSWNEWEYISAANRTSADARQEPSWQEEILAWYAKPATEPVAMVGRRPPNFYGVQDLHGMLWEWVFDYAAMLVSSDNREQQDADQSKFCGAGALSIEDKENYAVMMRVAMLSSLEGADSTSSLGFRCARDATTASAK